MTQLANAIRFLSMDAIQKSKSGHPGAPLGMAEMAEALWIHFLRHNPANPKFYNRDRFILSNGHASMLQYSLLHLTGYDVSIEDLQKFRQFKSKAPGHPEYGYTPGVETTTGPLGQGIANAVGMAIAEKLLAAEFNKENFNIVDHHTYAFLGDGCLMEGISHEVAALAGTLGLGKLIVLYDDNHISIDGDTSGWFTENIPERFTAYGWHVVSNVDGHNTEEICNALTEAHSIVSKPSLICCRTNIAQGSATKAGSHKTHGSPLGDEEIQATRKALNWPYAPFEIPEEIYNAWDAHERGAKLEKEWNELFGKYQTQYPKEAVEFIRRMNGRLPEHFNEHIQEALETCCEKKENLATRQASQNSIGVLANIMPELIGGSADLTPSNLTSWPEAVSVKKTGGGNYIHYGVREFGMAAAINGMVLHGGVRPFGATFLMFSEYARNALRMASLMHINSIFVFTHDSIGVGEDGPTHQPIEQLATLRLIPNMDVWRPCDTVESLVAWESAVLVQHNPSCLVFSRQTLPFVERSEEQILNIRRGGYILHAPENTPDAVVIATGSEVQLALEAQKQLEKEQIYIQVVSLPCTNLFDNQDEDYRNQVLPVGVPRVAVEAGIRDYWRRYVGLEGAIVGIDTFGESAPAEELFVHFGMTTDKVIEAVKSVLKKGESA